MKMVMYYLMLTEKYLFIKVFNVWWNVSGWHTPEYIRKREKLGK